MGSNPPNKIETVAGSQGEGALETVAGSQGSGSGSGPGEQVIVRRKVPEAGTLLGRYVVLSRVGAGAMGVVLSAYDPELDRRVAIKLVHRRRGSSPRDHQQLQREAQALARLNHPNVVAVYDVGDFDGQVFVAMEFVRGSTLATWLAGESGRGQVRPWREVLAVMLAAGEGLAQAHARGLVHRDFKPDNVMIGDDGRVRVMDFGLVWANEKVAMAGASARPIGLVGTPSYMAPEQFARGKVSARSDQFAFFVVLYEALYGRRPFAGNCVNSLAFNVLQGNVREPERGSSVPGWILQVVRRGLALSAEDRYADMREALAALGSGQARRRRSWTLVAAAAVLATVAGIQGYRGYELAQREAACERAGAVIEETWGYDARAAVHEGMLATGVDYADAAAQKVRPWIDRRAREWRASRVAACRNTTVHETWSRAELDKAGWCLEEQRASLRALVDALVDADPGAVQTAVQAAAKLSDPSVCIDDGVLAGLPEPPKADLRAQVSAVRDEVSRASALREAGRVPEGLEVASRARRSAEALEWEPIVASALTTEATLLLSAGRYAESESSGTRGYLIAIRSSAWGTAANAATALAFTVGFAARRHDEGLLWAEHAKAAIHHCGDPMQLREASRMASVGAIHASTGEFEQAMAAIEQVLEIVEAKLGPEHPNTGLVLNNLATIYQKAGASDRAHKSAAQALAIWEVTLGPEHPNTAAALQTVGGIRAEIGDHGAALSLFQRALETREAALGPTHPMVAETLTRIARSQRAIGAKAEARDSHVRAVTIMTELGARNSSIHGVLVELAELELELGRAQVAVGYLERALALIESEPNAAKLVASTRFALAEAIWARPDLEAVERRRALTEARQARETLERLGEDDAAAPVAAWLKLR